MVLEDYKTLGKHEQWTELWGYGKSLTNYISTDRSFQLYAPHGFFVEVELDTLTGRPLSKKAFRGGKRSDKYYYPGNGVYQRPRSITTYKKALSSATIDQESKYNGTIARWESVRISHYECTNRS